MKHSDIVVTVHDINQYTNDNQQLDQRLNDLKGQQAAKESDKQSLSQKIQQYKGERQQIDNDVESMNYQLVKATEAFEKYTGQLNVLEERKKNQSETNARYEEEQENLNELLENIINEQTEAKSALETLKTKQKELNGIIRQLEEQLYISDEAHDEKLEEIKMNTTL